MPNIHADAPLRHKCESCRIWHDHGDPCQGEPKTDLTIRYEDPYEEATVTVKANTDPEATYQETVELAKALQKPLLPTPRALEHVLAVLGWQCAYDLRSQQAWLRPGRGKWIEATDRKVAAIRRDISATFKTPTDKPLKYGRVLWEDCLNAVLDDRETDFFVEWLETLPPWDGHRRVDGWLHSCFDIDPLDELATWAARFLLLGAVSRAYEPGMKLDETPVLVGAQGIGKSTALRLLFPASEWGSRWFADGLHLAADPKTRAEALQGRVLVEASEMAGSTRADLEDAQSVPVAHRRRHHPPRIPPQPRIQPTAGHHLRHLQQHRIAPQRRDRQPAIRRDRARRRQRQPRTRVPQRQPRPDVGRGHRPVPRRRRGPPTGSVEAGPSRPQ